MKRPNSILNRTDIFVGLNICSIVFCLAIILFTWYRTIYVGDHLYMHNEGYEEALLFAAAGGCIFNLLNATLLIYPAARRSIATQSNLTEKTQSLQIQATTDALTGMNNRRFFEDALSDYLNEFNKIGATLGLLILDLDHFKNVNDNYGHDVGDQVLKEVALRMRAISREHDIVARLGGEEFAVITPYASKEQLLGVAERYRLMVEDLKIKSGNVIIRPTVSIGVSTNEGDVTNPDDLFKAADKKLYEAKNAGRNRVAA